MITMFLTIFAYIIALLIAILFCLGYNSRNCISDILALRKNSKPEISDNDIELQDLPSAEGLLNTKNETHKSRENENRGFFNKIGRKIGIKKHDMTYVTCPERNEQTQRENGD